MIVSKKPFNDVILEVLKLPNPSKKGFSG